ncbi:hypothetical protein AAE02nite_31840 [Adhaeribacter aerolatus]|uniref:Uncharacterized protein n=1 Tax=Adhaeribacter aerolatus TaxID=670289 RepID=A0A512B0N1_9BACT|nr:hypothetical protein [Adhaeribacter aerolatus]GEO05520.1 hypothetical protein AAE02nite_31840 [Adhaeribacter aerolatus]
MSIEKLAAKSDYTWGIDTDVVWIRDLDNGGMSVTNNIQNIINHLSEHLPIKEYRLMYGDSLGKWDGLKFIGSGLKVDFFSLNEMDYHKVIQKLRHVV